MILTLYFNISYVTLCIIINISKTYQSHPSFTNYTELALDDYRLLKIFHSKFLFSRNEQFKCIAPCGISKNLLRNTFKTSQERRL